LDTQSAWAGGSHTSCASNTRLQEIRNYCTAVESVATESAGSSSAGATISVESAAVSVSVAAEFSLLGVQATASDAITIKDAIDFTIVFIGFKEICPSYRLFEKVTQEKKGNFLWVTFGASQYKTDFDNLCTISTS